MGPAYNPLAPLAHRNSVTAVDASDPADTTGAVDCEGFQECRFELTLAGVDLTSLEVAALFWNARQSKWFTGGSRVFTSTGQHALVATVRGAVVFLKVVAFTGTSFTLDVDYVLS
jgi:hypothetical protein